MNPKNSDNDASEPRGTFSSRAYADVDQPAIPKLLVPPRSLSYPTIRGRDTDKPSAERRELKFSPPEGSPQSRTARRSSKTDNPGSNSIYTTPISSREDMQLPPDDISKDSLMQERDRLVQDLKESQNRAAGLAAEFKEMERLHERALDDCSRAKAQCSQLQSELEDARSHIFSLQPHRKELTPETVSTEYATIIECVEDWAEDLLSPILAKPESVEYAVGSRARLNPRAWENLKKEMRNQDTLLDYTSQYANIDPSIVTAIIMRFLLTEIFQTKLYGIFPEVTQMLSMMQIHLSNLRPTRDIRAIRSWRTESWEALMGTESFQHYRQKEAHGIAEDLATKFELFMDRRTKRDMINILLSKCVLPAMDLYEKMQTSTIEYRLKETVLFDPITHHDGSPRLKKTLLPEDLEQFEAKNVLENMKKVTFARMDPNTTAQTLMKDIRPLCTLAPAIRMRKIHQDGISGCWVVVSKQRVLVASGSAEKDAAAKDTKDNEPRLMMAVTRLPRQRSFFAR